MGINHIPFFAEEMQAETKKDEEENVVADKLDGVLPWGEVPGAFVSVGKVGDIGHLECDPLDKL